MGKNDGGTLKQFDYENLEVGDDLGTRSFVITDEMIQDCTEAIESHHDWYFKDSPFGGRIAPPTIFDNTSLQMLDTSRANHFRSESQCITRKDQFSQRDVHLSFPQPRLTKRP